MLLPIYLLVDFWTGLACTFFFSAEYLLSTFLYTNQKEIFGEYHFTVMLILHLAAWIAQFVGHGVYEGRAPALLDNMLLIFVAPFFFMFEVLNYVLGYKAKDVKEWNKVVALEVKQFRDGKVKKRTE